MSIIVLMVVIVHWVNHTNHAQNATRDGRVHDAKKEYAPTQKTNTAMTQATSHHDRNVTSNAKMVEHASSATTL